MWPLSSSKYNEVQCVHATIHMPRCKLCKYMHGMCIVCVIFFTNHIRQLMTCHVTSIVTCHNNHYNKYCHSLFFAAIGSLIPTLSPPCACSCCAWPNSSYIYAATHHVVYNYQGLILVHGYFVLHTHHT